VRGLLHQRFAAGLRASELASILDVGDLSLRTAIYILLRCSKIDQDQAGRDFIVARGQHPETCPVRAIQARIKTARTDQTGGALFRAVSRHGKVNSNALSRRSESKILKAASIRTAFDPRKIPPRGLLTGMCTAARLAGQPVIAPTLVIRVAA
jgi:hypothetical protein